MIDTEVYISVCVDGWIHTGMYAPHLIRRFTSGIHNSVQFKRQLFRKKISDYQHFPSFSIKLPNFAQLFSDENSTSRLIAISTEADTCRFYLIASLLSRRNLTLIQYVPTSVLLANPVISTPYVHIL